ncbi:Putative CRISPR type III-B/RAMP module RAMP protein Cmr4 [Desulfonema limicola]|uniref:CRISPR type III-B/RAMP module RAMP protein Cmr4 n=1 Tax=Desulfonema limicola TaxID=45656 RepID=A0A975GGF3_9BACT|nr:type III-B CRISPR module RAMP protein Cmr4 [Desulfonema limicola]QTA80261.1 Putative CRISPR type III-B/RAMP module RAMP protein Cmr4 [Desulfonema limicola]
MFKASKIMFLYTESSIHPGAGDSTGVVDLPIQREIHTQLPIIQGSELKGALREYFEKKYSQNNTEVNLIFGKPSDSLGTGAGGALGFSMSKIVLFPLASLKGVFAYVTCPMCLESLRQDMNSTASTNLAGSGLDNIPLPGENTALVPKGSDSVSINGKIVLSEFPFDCIENDNLGTIAKWLSERLPGDNKYFKDKLYKKTGNKIQSNLVLIQDDIFKDLLQIKTEVVHRNVLDDKGISKNLWTEENLPADTLLFSMLYAADPYEESEKIKTAADVAGYLENEKLSSFIIGGNQTVGRGWVSVTFA